ncbi:MAG TPA: hypothetical protein VI454_13795 [Verrucomicrobiae bacterium]|jgi:hypothetical protein
MNTDEHGFGERGRLAGHIRFGWRRQRISFGRTALEPKAALCAKPEPMSVWLRHRVPASNWMLRGLLGAVPHDEAPERNPFKSLNFDATKGP